MNGPIPTQKRTRARHATGSSHSKGGYDYKAVQEIVWFAATAVAIQVAQILVQFDPNAITDWRTYALSIVGASVRAIAGAVIAKLAPGRPKE